MRRLLKEGDGKGKGQTLKACENQVQVQCQANKLIFIVYKLNDSTHGVCVLRQLIAAYLFNNCIMKQ